MSLRPNNSSHTETVILSQKTMEDWLSMKSEYSFSNTLDDLKVETVAAAIRTKFRLQKMDAVGWFKEDCRDQDTILEGVYLKSFQIKMYLRHFWSEERKEILVKEKDLEDGIWELQKNSQMYTRVNYQDAHGGMFYSDQNKWTVEGVGVITSWESRSTHDPARPPALKKRRL